MTTTNTITAQSMTDVRDIQDGLQIRAFGFIRKHQGAHLNRHQLLRRTIGYLKDMHPMSNDTAEKIAARALCEYESHKIALSLDLESSTRFMLVINDSQRNCQRIFSMADILQLLSTAELAPVRTPSYAAAMSGQDLASR